MNGFGRRDDDRVVADELNAISVDGELLTVSAGCNVDRIPARNRVDSVLNAFPGSDVNGAAVLMVVFIAVFPVVVLRLRVLVLAATPIFPLAFTRIPA